MGESVRRAIDQESPCQRCLSCLTSGHWTTSRFRRSPNRHVRVEPEPERLPFQIFPQAEGPRVSRRATIRRRLHPPPLSSVPTTSAPPAYAGSRSASLSIRSSIAIRPSVSSSIERRTVGSDSRGCEFIAAPARCRGIESSQLPCCRWMPMIRGGARLLATGNVVRCLSRIARVASKAMHSLPRSAPRSGERGAVTCDPNLPAMISGREFIDRDANWS